MVSTRAPIVPLCAAAVTDFPGRWFRGRGPRNPDARRGRRGQDANVQPLDPATASAVPDRDVAAFDERAAGYESGRLGQWHRQIADRTAARALACQRAPQRVLDVGCGTGYLLRRLAAQVPDTGARFVGVDLAPRMLQVASWRAGDPRLRFARAAAERLPVADAAFDLVVSTTSFDHWADQR